MHFQRNGFFLTSILAAMTFVSAGCDGTDDGKVSTEIDGNWIAECTPSKTKQQFKVEDGTWTWVYAYFNDDACTEKVRLYEASGLFLTGVGVDAPSGANKLNLEFKKSSLTAQSDDVVATNNAQSVCGKTDWAKDTPVDIIACTALQAKDQYTVYKLDRAAGTLQLGECNSSNDFCAAEEKRALTLSDAVFKK